jgi:ubiquinone/menaquinone biosynthesis C-methylase UbiE
MMNTATGINQETMNAKATKWNALFDNGAKYRDLNEIYILDLIDQFEKISGHKPASVVDLGCGNGETLSKFSSFGIPVIGVDVADVALDQAKKKLEESGLEFSLILHDLDQMETLRIDVPENTLWICKLVLAFIEDKLGFLQNVRNLMKSGDQLLVMTPVLRVGVSYTKEDKPGIAIGINEIVSLLTDALGGFTIFSDEYLGERGKVVSYLMFKK